MQAVSQQLTFQPGIRTVLNTFQTVSQLVSSPAVMVSCRISGRSFIKYLFSGLGPNGFSRRHRYWGGVRQPSLYNRVPGTCSIRVCSHTVFSNACAINVSMLLAKTETQLCECAKTWAIAVCLRRWSYGMFRQRLFIRLLMIEYIDCQTSLKEHQSRRQRQNRRKVARFRKARPATESKYSHTLPMNAKLQ
ncbi:hypothetical protein OE88DRAFT_1545315 [Heliocybe sulcata]|uniref:Uncharacterized protein n=1 Tax=Heliocybe sulcata TaxID=5364 RepID=A0A5C3N2B8_9AGAM|nr:hypothetical protein OE88DRAFT_1545315 [Heliocybe sulcata]